MRVKENAHDYRYFPEPDLGGITIEQAYINQIESMLPPLPNFLYKKYINELGLSDYDAINIVENRDIALYFEEIIKHT